MCTKDTMEAEMAWSMTGMSTLFGRDTVEGFKTSKHRRLESEQKSSEDLSRRRNVCAILAVVIHDIEADRAVLWRRNRLDWDKYLQEMRHSQILKTVIRPISDFWSPEGGHNDVSEYESLINISLNTVLPKLPDNHDRAHRPSGKNKMRVENMSIVLQRKDLSWKEVTKNEQTSLDDRCLRDHIVRHR